jgi:hypothetical protein
VGRLVAVLLLGLALAGCGPGREAREREARAVAYADTVAAAYGGGDAWRALHFMRFDLSFRESGQVRARFRHLWDLTTGDCRYEGDLAVLRDLPRRPETARRIPRGTVFPNGQLVAVVNLKTGQGQARVEPPPGNPGEGPATEALLALARERLEEDGLWLFLPFLLRDPGVTLADMGLVTGPVTGRPAREIRMTRKGDARAVRIFVDPGTHRILETEASAPGAAAPLALVWRSEVGVGGLKLVAERQETETRSLMYDLMAAPERISPDVFTDLSRRMPY